MKSSGQTLLIKFSVGIDLVNASLSMIEVTVLFSQNVIKIVTVIIKFQILLRILQSLQQD
jgi:hypothetical protein